MTRPKRAKAWGELPKGWRQWVIDDLTNYRKTGALADDEVCIAYDAAIAVLERAGRRGKGKG